MVRTSTIRRASMSATSFRPTRTQTEPPHRWWVSLNCFPFVVRNFVRLNWAYKMRWLWVSRERTSSVIHGEHTTCAVKPTQRRRNSWIFFLKKELWKDRWRTRRSKATEKISFKRRHKEWVAPSRSPSLRLRLLQCSKTKCSSCSITK